VTEEPGRIEIDRSGIEPVISVEHPSGPFSPDRLRKYAEFLATVAEEAAARPDPPEVEELIAVLNASEARWLPYEEAVRELARAILAAGYERKSAATGTEG
jgi:hypothetical protein